jgi:hypothetical protein
MASARFFFMAYLAKDDIADFLRFLVVAEHPRSVSSQLRNSSIVSPLNDANVTFSGVSPLFAFKNSNSNWKAYSYDVMVFLLTPFVSGRYDEK